MDIVMTGRNVDVPTHYRVHVTDKLVRLHRYNSHVIRYDVELYHEKNPRQSKTCQRVEITSTGKGPTARAEACGPDFYTALDTAVGKLEAQLRRSHDRRRGHHGKHQPTPLAATPAPLATALFTNPGARQHTTTNPHEHPRHEHHWESTDVEGAGHIVREKEHSGEPITIDQALSYRRKGFDYGVIRLV
jgi:ribosomal subunit interface protein